MANISFSGGGGEKPQSDQEKAAETRVEPEDAIREKESSSESDPMTDMGETTSGGPMSGPRGGGSADTAQGSSTGSKSSDVGGPANTSFDEQGNPEVSGSGEAPEDTPPAGGESTSSVGGPANTQFTESGDPEVSGTGESPGETPKAGGASTSNVGGPANTNFDAENNPTVSGTGRPPGATQPAGGGEPGTTSETTTAPPIGDSTTSGDGGSGADSTVSSGLAFDSTNPTYEGRTYSQVENDLIQDRGARDIEYAEVDGGLVARFKVDGRVGFASVPLEEGSSTRVNQIASGLQEEANESLFADQLSGVSSGDVEIENGELVSVSKDGQEALGRSLLAQDGALSSDKANSLDLGEDFQVRFTEDGGATVSLTPFGQKELARQDVEASTGLDAREDFTVSFEQGDGNSGSSVDVALTGDGAQEVREQRQERAQDLRAGAAAATSGSGELARGIDATEFESFDHAVNVVRRDIETEYPGLDSGEDYTVEIREDGTLAAELTDSGKEAVADTQRLIQDSAAVATSGSGELARRTPDLLTADQEARQAAAARRQQALEGIQAQARSEGLNTNLLEAQTGLDVNQDGDVKSPEEYVAEQFEERVETQTDVSLTSSDIQVSSDGNQVQAGLSGSGEQKLESVLESESFTAKVPSNIPLVGGASTTLKGDAREVDVESTDGEITVQTNEQFGDIDWSLGLGGPGDEIEQSAAGAGQFAVDVTSAASDELFGGNGVASESLGDEILTAAGYPGVGQAYENNLERFGRGLANAPGQFANAASTVPFEAVELGAETLTNPNETASELPTAAAGAGAAFASTAAAKPARTSGAVVGSLAFSRGLFVATQGTRLGTAVRYSVQPGEELVKAAAGRGLISSSTAAKVPGVRRQSLGASVRDAGSRVRGAGSRVRDTVSDRTPDVSGQDVVNRARLGYQRLRYSRPSKQDPPQIDLGDADDVDAVYVEDFRPSDLEAESSDDEPEFGGSGGGAGTMGTTFDGPAVEVDVGGGQIQLLRTRADTETELDSGADLRAPLRGEGEVEVTDTSLGVGLEPATMLGEDTTTVGADPVGLTTTGGLTDTVVEETATREVPVDVAGVGVAQETAQGQSPVAGVETELGLGAATETAPVLGVESETVTGAAVEQDSLSVGIETGVGIETAVESESEQESDVPLGQPDSRDDPLGFGFAGNSEQFVQELMDPLADGRDDDSSRQTRKSDSDGNGFDPWL